MKNSEEHDFGRFVSAVRNGDFTILKELITEGIDLEKLFPPAIFCCHASTLEFLIEQGLPFNNERIGARLLLRACHVNNTSIAGFLLQKGVDPNSVELWVENRPNTWITPLVTVSVYGHAKVAKILIKYGANVSFTNKSVPLRPLIIAMKNRRHETAEVLWDAGARDVSDLAWFAFQGDLDKVRSLIKSGSSVDPNRSDEVSALYFAALENRGEISDLLLQHGANPERSVTLPALFTNKDFQLNIPFHR